MGCSCLRTGHSPLLGHISLIAPGPNLLDATYLRGRGAWGTDAEANLLFANPGNKKAIPCWMRSTKGTHLPEQGSATLASLTFFLLNSAEEAVAPPRSIAPITTGVKHRGSWRGR